MNSDECALAMTALRAAWQYTPMSDVQARQFQRLFDGYPTEVVRDVLDDLIRLGVTRPGPAEMGELLRTKMGRPTHGGRVRHDGPYHDPTDPNITHPDAVGSRVDQLRTAISK
jgi:hypothetical protein